MRGRLGSGEWWAGVFFLVAVLVGLVAPVLQLVGVLGPVVSHWLVHAVGLVLAVLGVGATLSAQGGMGDSWRVGVDSGEVTGLVTSGAFAVVRNPIFAAMVVAGVG
jgi:protein-S-isoprenylcysteine O-methyltransferase Ste14